MATRLTQAGAVAKVLSNDPDPIFQWYVNIRLMDRWPSLSMEYLFKIKDEEPNLYLFLILVHNERQRIENDHILKQKAEYDKLKAKAKAKR